MRQKHLIRETVEESLTVETGTTAYLEDGREVPSAAIVIANFNASRTGDSIVASIYGPVDVIIDALERALAVLRGRDSDP